MSLEIKSIEGVICLQGALSTNRITEMNSYFKTLLEFEPHVIVNLCGLTNGQNALIPLFNEIQSSLNVDQSFTFYGATDVKVKALYQQLNNPANFYQAA